ncbi:hypothetical protein HRG_002545 [Hirsutella rhossiliensis]|uniref:DUF7053 domain-containing protein n=1 Tax=Hirsutella rhossiliensis TaxID=111463 RepID=A0A9P8N706_9HYPO|nr:uncharacterized protein HRG_02545 [Hirsutella rhossiliensis]KAH0967136.1 hypothetical protein HRG_02545 [Hirsutella rhossiliensis]
MVYALSAGLWDSDVVSTYEFIVVKRGVFVPVRSPITTTLKTVWEIHEAEDGSLALVEDVVMHCSRFFIAIVKSTCESGWRDFHGKIFRELQQQAS